MCSHRTRCVTHVLIEQTVVQNGESPGSIQLIGTRQVFANRDFRHSGERSADFHNSLPL
jgi:hypothetical protein